MRVLQAIDRLNVGGAERTFIDICKLLHDNVTAVDALVFNIGFPLDDSLDKNIKLHVLGRTNKFSPAQLYRLHLLCSQYNIVHAHMRHVYAYIRLAQIIFRGKYKLILHDHNSDMAAVPATLKGLFRPKCYIATLASQLAWAKDQLGIAEKNTFFLPNTIIPQSDINYTANDKADSLLMVANLSPVKNIEFAIEIAKSAGVPLTIYGNTIAQDYSNNLDTLIAGADINIQKGITDFSEVYNKHTLAIHCSKRETGPLVLLEYLAYGIPFLAYKTGQVAETIAAELPLLFIDNFDTDQWKQRIELIKAEANLSARLKEFFHKYFNPQDYLNKCQQVYQSVNC